MKCKSCGYDSFPTAAEIASRVLKHRERSGIEFAGDVDVFLPKADFVHLEQALAPQLRYPTNENVPTLTMRDSFGRIQLWPYDGDQLVIGRASHGR